MTKYKTYKVIVAGRLGINKPSIATIKVPKKMLPKGKQKIPLRMLVGGKVPKVKSLV